MLLLKKAPDACASGACGGLGLGDLQNGFLQVAVGGAFEFGVEEDLLEAVANSSAICRGAGEVFDFGKTFGKVFVLHFTSDDFFAALFDFVGGPGIFFLGVRFAGEGSANATENESNETE